MLTKLTNYSYEFIHFVEKFARDHHLQLNTKRSVIGLSAGVDSVVLLTVISYLYKLKKIPFMPRAIMVDHGTRESIELERALMTKLCQRLGVELTIEKADFEKSSNFEHNARCARYKIFHKNLRNNEILLLGHHINDSLEWSLLQSLKSSKIQSSLGIPVKNKVIRRPLMCVTKKHILRFADEMMLSWTNDETNDDLDYERNRIRWHLNELEKFHPKQYANYVHRHNDLAKKLRLHVQSRSLTKKRVLEREWGHIIIYEDRLIRVDEIERRLIEKSSEKKRGKLRSQLERLDQLISSDKIGPLNFSGGVKVYSFSQLLLVVKKDKKVNFTTIASQIPERVPFYSQVTKKNALKNPPLIGPVGDGKHLNYSYRFNESEVIYWI